MKQELPQLVDERRFRRREQETVERDEFGRVCVPAVSPNRRTVTDLVSANGRKRRYPSTWSLCLGSTSALRLSVTAVRMSSTSSRRLVAVFRSRAAVLASWKSPLDVRAMRICSFMLPALIRRWWRKPRSSARISSPT